MIGDEMDAERYARAFHETYERLAPSYGYETRQETGVPWDDVPEPNRTLMIAVAAEVVGPLERELADVRAEWQKQTADWNTEMDRLRGERDRWRRIAHEHGAPN